MRESGLENCISFLCAHTHFLARHWCYWSVRFSVVDVSVSMVAGGWRLIDIQAGVSTIWKGVVCVLLFGRL